MDSLTPSVVLVTYAESLLDGRRAVVFGDSTSPVAEELALRGARSVHVFDPEPARAAEAAGRNRSKQLSIVPLDEADVAVRDGAFDVAIVTDLSLARDPALLLERVRSALGPRGTALVASPNPEVKLTLMPRAAGKRNALGYYELYDLVSAAFPEVRMLGQTPFVGYAVVDFAPAGEPDVSIDSSLVPGGAEEPEWFVALASREPTELDEYSVVQLPAGRVIGSKVDPKLGDDLRVARAAEARLAGIVEELETKVVELRKAAAAPKVADAGEERHAAERDAKLAESTKLAAERDAKVTELAKLIAERDARVAELAKGIEARAATATALEKEKKELEARLAEVTRERDEARAAVLGRDTEIARLKEIAALAAAPGDGPDDVARLEAALLERSERIRALEATLREAERIGKEVVGELALTRRSEGARTEGKGPSPLAHENARLRADLEALGWTLEELEGRLARAPAPPPTPPAPR